PGTGRTSRRIRGWQTRCGGGSARAKQASKRLLDIEGDLAAALARDVDAVAGAQLRRLAVHVRAVGDEVARLIDEAVPYIYELAAEVGYDPAVNIVESDHVRRHGAGLEREIAHPDQRHALIADILGKRG